MTGYKVVSESESNLISCSMDKLEAMMLYKIDEWVWPKRGCGPLSLFNSLENAMRFNECCFLTLRPVFKCEYIPSLQTWLSYNYNAKYLYPDSFPKGTLLANAIKLVGIVFDGSHASYEDSEAAEKWNKELKLRFGRAHK